MSKLIAMRGLPASGKTTRAREIVLNDPSYLRVSRDDLRSMFFGVPFLPKQDKILNKVEKEMLTSILRAGRNVVLDSTNLTQSRQQELIELCNANKIKLVFEDINTDVDECIRRDAQRDFSVGREVVERFALAFGMNPWENELAIFDMDGTLTDPSWRQHLIAGIVDLDDKVVRDAHPHWKEFLDGCDKDPCREHVKEMLLEQHALGRQIIIVTARNQGYGKKSIEWLNRNGIPFSRIFMRIEGDGRGDDIVKKEILELMPKGRIKVVVDDRPKVLRMWTSELLDYDVDIRDVGDGVEF